MTKGYRTTRLQEDIIKDHLDLFPSQVKQMEEMQNISTTTIRKIQKRYEDE